MAKKCLPGVFCIEYMTLFFIILIFIFCIFIYFTLFNKQQSNIIHNKLISFEQPISEKYMIGLAKPDIFSDPYFPPLSNKGIPINIETQTIHSSFNQIGILTRQTHNSELILPIFGRNLFSNRNKWQYYTLSNTGNISSKLPIRIHNKDGMNEYGVDEIFNNDTIYVQGYNDIFLATIYESQRIPYIPYL